jgi:hypothetical protein
MYVESIGWTPAVHMNQNYIYAEYYENAKTTPSIHLNFWIRGTALLNHLPN